MQKNPLLDPKNYLMAGLTVLAACFLFLKNTPAAPEPVVEAGEVKGESIPEPVYMFEKKVFGKSVTGRDIEGYEIGSGEEVLLLHASTHGDEMGTVDLLNKLVEEIQASSTLVSVNKRLVIIPILNPDGYYDRTDKLNANGVNLNLNFPTTKWAKYGPGGTFAGNEPFSEPESRVLKEVVELYKPSLMIAYHSEGGIVLPELEAPSIELAKWYSKKSGYTYNDTWDYAGTATKWFEEAYHKPSITVEITERFKSDWEKNKRVLMELINSYSAE